MSVLHSGGLTTLSYLCKMRALKIFAIILITCSCCGYAAPPTDTLTSMLEKLRPQIPQYKDTLLNSTFLPFLNNCDKTETTSIMCTSYMEMVILLSKTENQTLFMTQADVSDRLKQFNTSNDFSTFCTKFTENYPNNTKYYDRLSNKLYCLQSCADINEKSNIRQQCGLIYIGYAELGALKHIPTHPPSLVTIPKEEKSKGQSEIPVNIDAIKTQTSGIAKMASEIANDTKKPENQQSQASAQESPELVPPPAAPVVAPVKNIGIPNISTPLKNETTNTAALPKVEPKAIPKSLPEEAKAIETHESAHAPKDVAAQPAEHNAIVTPPEQSKSVPQSEEELENHEDEDPNETVTDLNLDDVAHDDNEDIENPNTDQESRPVIVKYEKPQKLEVSPGNLKDTVIIRTAVADDPYADNSNFFAYFMFSMFVCVVCYVGYHNKSKVFALVLEGRRTSGGRNGIGRRKHTAAYRKLDTNLEEAISSNSSGRTTQIIY